ATPEPASGSARPWRHALTTRVAACVLVGMLGGVVAAGAADLSTPRMIGLGALYGLLFGLLASSRAVSAGSGLLWGLGYGYLLWLVGPAGLFALGNASHMAQLNTAQQHFPELAAYLLCIGAPLGLTLGLWGIRSPQAAAQQVRS